MRVGLDIRPGLQKAAFHLLVPQDGPFFQLMQEPVLFSDPSTAFAKVSKLVSAQVNLQVSLLSCPVVTIGALKRFLSSVGAHVERQDAIKTKSLPTQGTWVFSVLPSIVLYVTHLRHNAQVLSI